MSQELLYTSAPRGLKPGSRGFCTVVCTRDMPPALAAGLESLSAYRHVFPPGDPNAERNPVAWSHVRLSAGGKTYSVLSRVGDFGLDYSHRGNKLAHHVVLELSERPAGGPAWLLGQPGFMASSWDGNPRLLAQGRSPRTGAAPRASCAAWRRITGDAGWAGVLVESFLANPERPVYLIFDPGQDLLPLVQEAIALLPPERRWDVTFNTFFTGLPAGAVCAWRCVLPDSPELEQARRFGQAVQIDLCGLLPAAAGGEFVELARGNGTPSGRAAFASPAGNTEAESWPRDERVSVEGPDPFEPLRQEVEVYGLQGSAAAPKGMPPPPPTRRRRPSARDNAQSRRHTLRKRQVAVVAALLVVIVGGAGVWLFRKPLFGEQRAEAQADRDGKSARPVEPSNRSPGKTRKKDARRTADRARKLKDDGELAAVSEEAADEDSEPTRESTQDEDRQSARAEKSKPKAESGEGAGAAPETADPGIAEAEESKPARPAIAIFYEGQRLTRGRNSDCFFLTPAPGGSLKIEAGEADGLAWRLLPPEERPREFRVESPSGDKQPFSQKLVAPSTEGTGGTVMLFALREKPLPEGSDHAASLIGFYPGTEAPALVERIRWTVIEIKAPGNENGELVALHDPVALPEPRQLKNGKALWQIESWGETAPPLFVERIELDLQLTHARLPLVFEFDGGEEANRARLTCSGESRDLIRKRQEEGEWSEDLSAPELLVTIKFDAKTKKAIEISIVVPVPGTKRLEEDIFRASASLAAAPSQFGLGKSKLETGASAEASIREALKKIDERLKAAADAEAGPSDPAAAQLQSLRNLQNDLRQLAARVKLATASRQRLSGAQITGARIFYRVQGRDDKIDVILTPQRNEPAKKTGTR